MSNSLSNLSHDGECLKKRGEVLKPPPKLLCNRGNYKDYLEGTLIVPKSVKSGCALLIPVKADNPLDA